MEAFVSKTGSADFQNTSLRLVQIFLNSSLACISHMRELIPWQSECFEIRHVAQLRPQPDVKPVNLYEHFCSLGSTGEVGSQEIRILRRGKNSRADHILDLLENGVKHALERGYLEALQVLVTGDIAEPHSVVESYTFTFTYEEKKISQVSIYDVGGTFASRNLEKSFGSAIRSLLRAMKGLPRLPAQRRLGMSLVYREHCPLRYEPAGFVEGQIWNEHWEDQVDATHITSLQTGQHRIDIVGHKSVSDSQEKDARISRQLEDMQQTSSRGSELAATQPPPSQWFDPTRPPKTPSTRHRELPSLKGQVQKRKVPLAPADDGSRSPALDDATRPPRRRKISISGTFVDVGVRGSSPSSEDSGDDGSCSDDFA